MHEMLSIGKKDKTLTGLNISLYQHEFDMNKSNWESLKHKESCRIIRNRLTQLYIFPLIIKMYLRLGPKIILVTYHPICNAIALVI